MKIIPFILAFLFLATKAELLGGAFRLWRLPQRSGLRGVNPLLSRLRSAGL